MEGERYLIQHKDKNLGGKKHTSALIFQPQIKREKEWEKEIWASG